MWLVQLVTQTSTHECFLGSTIILWLVAEVLGVYTNLVTRNIEKVCTHEQKSNKINFYNFIRIFLGESDFLVVVDLSRVHGSKEYSDY